MALWRVAVMAFVPLCATASLYSTYTFDALQHLSGVAPYFQPQDPPVSPEPPQGCTPSRVAYLVRHAAIFANDDDLESYIDPFVSKWQNHRSIDWSHVPALSFLASWTPPVSDAQAELLTRTGKLEAAQLGVTLSLRYPGLRLPQRVWASSAERTFQSAKSLVRGLETDDNTIQVVTVSESKKAGANSLTPYRSCPAYNSSAGSDQTAVYRDRFTKPIRARLNALVPGFDFTAEDVYGMMELCGYETVIRGSSPFCDLALFTPDDWLGWEYTADIQYHYSMGYGNHLSGYLGLPWLNATAHLLMSPEASPNVQDMYVSFTHRELLPTVLVALGLFNNSAWGGTAHGINATMPLDGVNHSRAWKSSHVLTFLGNVAMERLTCTGSYGFVDGDYYRVLVNRAPQVLPGCTDGPGTSCSRHSFEAYLQGRVDGFSGFSKMCRAKSDTSPDVLTIYTDPAVGNGTLVGKRSWLTGQ